VVPYEKFIRGSAIQRVPQLYQLPICRKDVN